MNLTVGARRRIRPHPAGSLLIVTAVLLAGCGTGGSSDRTGRAYGEITPPQGDASPAQPPVASSPVVGSPQTPAEPPSDGSVGQPPSDTAAPSGRPRPGGPTQQAMPERRRPAPRETPVETRIAKKSEVYDPAGSHFDLLQAPREALRDLPIDGNGKVDWVRALEKGLIAPRASLSGSGGMQVLDQDIIMKKTRDMPWVRFPHRQHTEWLACSNCHPRPFVEKAGANPVSMDEIFRGQYCGMCHDRVAFSVFLCERCHTEPHPGAPARWW